MTTTSEHAESTIVLVAQINGTETTLTLTGDESGNTMNGEPDLSNLNEDEVCIDITQLLPMPLEEAALALDYLRAGPTSVRYTAGEGETGFSNPLDALLTIGLDANDLTEVTNRQRLITEVAAIWFPENLAVACARIRETFKAAGVKGLRASDLESQAAGKIRRGEAGDPHGDIASAFLMHRARLENMETEQLVIRFFRDEYLEFRSGGWVKLSEARLKGQVIKFARNQLHLTLDKQELGQVMINIQGACLLDSTTRPMPFVIEAETPLQLSDRNFVVFPNGILELDCFDEDGVPLFRAHDPRFMIESTLGFEYDLQAECPLWLEKLSDILPPEADDDHRIEILQEYFGWCLLLTGLRLERCLLTYGNGANGKSTVLGLLEAMLGEYNVSHLALGEFGERYRLPSLHGKYANIVSEMSRLTSVAVDRLNMIVSGDPIDVNVKYGKPILLHPTVKLIFATNVLPQICDDTDGAWRRLITMPFNRTFCREEQDTSLLRRLKEELQGIFNWALEGLARLRRQGNFTRCGVCERAAEEHRRTSSPVRLFVEEMAEFGSDSEVLKDDFFQAYLDWCIENRVENPENKIEFGRVLKNHFPEISPGRLSSGTRPRTYRGVQLLRQSV